MEKQEFERIDSLVDDIAEDVGNVIEGEALAMVKTKLAEISEILGEPYSVTLDINVNVFDLDRAKTLPLLQTGLSTSAGSNPHQCWGDSSPQRYGLFERVASISLNATAILDTFPQTLLRTTQITPKVAGELPFSPAKLPCHSQITSGLAHTYRQYLNLKLQVVFYSVF